MQRLEVLIAVMLARERRASTDALVDGCTELAAALATLPSGLLEIVAECLGHQVSIPSELDGSYELELG